MLEHVRAHEDRIFVFRAERQFRAEVLGQAAMKIASTPIARKPLYSV